VISPPFSVSSVLPVCRFFLGRDEFLGAVEELIVACPALNLKFQIRDCFGCGSAALCPLG
jgi:hypothetical protein